MKSTLIYLAAAVALLLGLLAGLRGIYSSGFNAGQRHAEQRLEADFTERQREDHRLARQLAEGARAEAGRWRDNAHELQLEVSRVRNLVVARAPACRPSPAQPLVTAGVAAGPGNAPSAPVPPPGRTDDDMGLSEGLPGDGLLLTADAVRVWDSAIVGRPMSAGACRADGTPTDACAAAVAITLGDAWANHVENAARCGIDRARHRRLIEFLQTRSTPQP